LIGFPLISCDKIALVTSSKFRVSFPYNNDVTR